MNQLSLTIIRVAFLAVLWLFVIAAIGVVRTDLLGGPANGRRGKVRQPQAPRQARPAKPARAGRGSNDNSPLKLRGSPGYLIAPKAANTLFLCRISTVRKPTAASNSI